MKPSSTTLSRDNIPVTASTAHQAHEVSNPFTWAKVHARIIQLKSRLPEPWDEILPTASERDTKIIFRLLVVGIAPLFGLCAIPILIVLLVRSMIGSGDKAKKGGVR